MNVAGQFCPSDYRYLVSDLARQADLHTGALYVVGGRYGNRCSLDIIDAMVTLEETSAVVAFNGDFHWFAAVPDHFAEANRRVMTHFLRCAATSKPNLLAQSASAQVVGCAYPQTVDDGTVDRSNWILERLRACVDALPGIREQFRALPMTLVAGVGALRVGIVHGDADALSGWRFAHDGLDAPTSHPWLDAVRAASAVDVYASSHTCLPALRDFQLQAGQLAIINNGAAGMPNFLGTSHGALTRIGTRPSPHRALYGIERDGVFIDALSVPCDQRQSRREFAETWPPGSPAYESYFSCIVGGPQFLQREAYLGAAIGTSQRCPSTYVG